MLIAQIRRELPHLRQHQARQLPRAARRLVTALRPERVYPFGSRVRGEATPDSDFDLLVVVPHSHLPPHQRDQKAYGTVGRHLVPLDILLMTHADFQQRKPAAASLPATVLREERVLYAA